MENSERPSIKTPAIAEQVALVIAYQVFVAAAQKYFAGSLAGKLIAGGGMGKSGAAQALAATMKGAAFLGIDADPEAIKRRVKSGYCDVMVNDLDEALRILKNAVRKGEAASVGLTGNCADVIPALAKRGVVPDLLIDRTAAHSYPDHYTPRGLNTSEACRLLEQDSRAYHLCAVESIKAQVEGLFALRELGSKVFFWGDRIHAERIANAFTEFLAPKLAEGSAPIYVAAPSGQTADIRRIDSLILELFSQDEPLARWTRLVQKRVRFQNPPARAYWLNGEQRGKLRDGINDLVAKGELKAPVTIGEYLVDSST